MKTIWIITEKAEESFGLIREGIKLGGESISAFVGKDSADECYQYGATEVFTLQLADKIPWEEYAQQLAHLTVEKKPQLILVSASKRGMTLAAYLGGLLHIPVLSDIKSIKEENDKLVISRTIFGGLAEKKIAVPTNRRIIVTINAELFKGVKANNSALTTKAATPIEISASQSPLVLSRTPKKRNATNLADAAVVIGVGRGFGSKDNIQYAQALAQLLGGEIACSRPVAEDLKWLPEERYIGITGQKICPQLYLCAGISGQIQHVYGVRDAKRIVAINKDENAPIFKAADYYIVGDLTKELPAIVKALKA